MRGSAAMPLLPPQRRGRPLVDPLPAPPCASARLPARLPVNRPPASACLLPSRAAFAEIVVSRLDPSMPAFAHHREYCTALYRAVLCTPRAACMPCRQRPAPRAPRAGLHRAGLHRAGLHCAGLAAPRWARCAGQAALGMHALSRACMLCRMHASLRPPTQHPTIPPAAPPLADFTASCMLDWLKRLTQLMQDFAEQCFILMMCACRRA